MRNGLHVADLLFPSTLEEKIQETTAIVNALLNLHGADSLDPNKIFDEVMGYRDAILPFIYRDATGLLQDHDGHILIEGAQGTLLDLDEGGYPNVTSSNTTVAGALVGMGKIMDIEKVVMILKAYHTRVGNGTLVTELGTPEQAENESKDDPLTETDLTQAEAGLEYPLGMVLRKKGGEYGTTTGRPRRCGWFDAVAAQHSLRVNRPTIPGKEAEIALTKLDVLDPLKTIRVCIGYNIEGQETTLFPQQEEELALAKPIYEDFPGWQQDTTGAREFSDLPPNAQSYVQALEGILKRDVSIVSVGPRRDQTIIRASFYS